MTFADPRPGRILGLIEGGPVGLLLLILVVLLVLLLVRGR